MIGINSLNIKVVKIGFSTKIYDTVINTIKDEKFKRAFRLGLIGISATGVFFFLAGKFKVMACELPVNNLHEVKPRRTWYQWSKSFLTPQTLGLFLGACTGLVLLSALDFHIKKSAEFLGNLEHAEAHIRGLELSFRGLKLSSDDYIKLLKESCLQWKDPNN